MPAPGNGLYDYRNSIAQQDDFIFGSSSDGSIGSLGFNFAGTYAAGVGIANRPGIVNLSTGAVLGTIARMNTFGSTSVIGSLKQITWIVSLVSNDANTIVRIGSVSAWNSDPPNEGVYFERLDTDTNWFAVTRTGSVSAARVDTGIATSVAYRKFSIKYTPTVIEYYIDDVLVATQTTQIPASSIVNTPGLHIKNSTAASKSMNIDYFSVLYSVTR